MSKWIQGGGSEKDGSDAFFRVEEDVIKAPTEEELKKLEEERKAEWRVRNAFRFIKLKDDEYTGVWERAEFPKKTYGQSTNGKTHIPNMIYTITEDKQHEKFVIKAGRRSGKAPFLSNIVTIGFEDLENTNERLREVFTNPAYRPKQIVDLELGNHNQDDHGLTFIISTMVQGEKCIVRSRTKCKETGQHRYRLRYCECLAIWTRTWISTPPYPVVFDVSSSGSREFWNTVDAEVCVHFKLYKRPRKEKAEPSFDADDGTWILVKDTREEGSAHATVVGAGTELPCFEHAMTRHFYEGAMGRIFACMETACGPYIKQDYKIPHTDWPEFERVDLSKYSDFGLENHDLLFLDYEVVSINERPVLNLGSVPLAERLAEAEYQKMRGNHFLSIEAYRKAAHRYELGYNVLMDDRPFSHLTPDEAKGPAKALLLNTALVYIRQSSFRSALPFIEEVLRVDPENVKALSRGALCWRSLGDYEAAFRAIDLAARRCPEDREIRRERLLVRELLREEEKERVAGLKKGLQEHVGEGFGLAEAVDEERKREMKFKSEALPQVWDALLQFKKEDAEIQQDH